MKLLLFISMFLGVFSMSAQETEKHNHGTFPQKMPFKQLFKIGDPCKFNIIQTETNEKTSVDADTLNFDIVSLGKVSEAVQQIVTANDSITNYRVETNSVTTTQQLIEQSSIDYGTPRVATDEGLNTLYSWRVELPNGKFVTYKLTVNKEKSHGFLIGKQR